MTEGLPVAAEIEVVAKARRRRFTAAEKLRILKEAHGCTKPGERLLEIPQPILLVRKNHEHGQVAAPVDQIHRLVALGLQIPDRIVLVHQRRLHRTAGLVIGEDLRVHLSHDLRRRSTTATPTTVKVAEQARG